MLILIHRRLIAERKAIDKEEKELLEDISTFCEASPLF